jgi:hypothetical protein
MDKTLDIMTSNLDTRDKRFMFLKICFPEVIPYVNIEGSPKNACFAIYNELGKRGYLPELEKKLQEIFV